MVEILDSAGLLVGRANIAPPPQTRGVAKAVARAMRCLGAGVALVRARRSGADTLYMSCDGGIGLAFNVLLATLARALGLSVWLHHHSFAYISRRSILMALLIVLGPVRTTHIVLCPDMLSDLASRYAKPWRRRDAQGWVLSNAFMVDQGAERRTAGQSRVLGHLSNLTVEKGALTFIALFGRLRDAGQPVRALIAGPVEDRQVALAIQQASAVYPGEFEWLGPVYGPAKAAFFASIDVFVFPSRYANEAQPLVLLEALAAGVPIVSTDRGCIGCDLSQAPGVVVHEEQFEEAAFQWCAALPAGAAGRSQDALRAFQLLRGASDNSLARLIETI